MSVGSTTSDDKLLGMKIKTEKTKTVYNFIWPRSILFSKDYQIQYACKLIMKRYNTIYTPEIKKRQCTGVHNIILCVGGPKF